MNSRDRLRDSKVAKNLKDDLYKLLAEDPILKRLNNKRREEQIKDVLKDDKPLSKIVQELVSKEQALAKLLEPGFQISSPFYGDDKPTKPYEGKQFPTFFHFEKKSQGEILKRDVEIGRKVRLTFKTDAENDYFNRSNDPGELNVLLNDEEFGEDSSYIRGPLRDGYCSVSIEFPASLKIDDKAKVSVTVNDIDNTKPFVSIAEITMIGKKVHKTNPKTPSNKEGLSIPDIKRVKKDEWEKYGFDRETSLTIKSSGRQTKSGYPAYDFFVNVENIYLKDAQKKSKISSDILEAKFTYALVVLTMAVLRDSEKSVGNDSKGGNDTDIESIVASLTKSLARVILPFLNSIGELSEEDIREGNNESSDII